MYTPPFNAVEDEQAIRAFVAATNVGWLVTVGRDGAPQATLLPVMWSGDTVVAHLAKANSHWREIGDGTAGLLICTGPDAYISPSWYAAKAEHGRVVPTWNYTAVHLSGPVRVHTDREWLREAVTSLTDVHEGERADRWHVTDAPEHYVDGQLGGIIGVELTVTRVEAKAKLSQNRSDADRRGAIAGLAAEGTPRAEAVAGDMSRALADGAS